MSGKYNIIEHIPIGLRPFGLVSLYVILIIQESFPRCFSPQHVVSEPIVVCGEGGEVFMVPTQRRQRKPKRPTHKDPGKEKKNAQQMNIANGAK